MPIGPLGIAAIAKGVDLVGGWIGQSQQRRENRRMRRYNSPKAQMARYRAAGLNPNLIYTQGSSGTWGSPQDYQSMYSGVGSSFIGDAQTSAQTDLTEAKTQESGVKQDLMEAQKALLDANPYMRKEYVDSMVLNLQSTAKLKEQEAGFMTSWQDVRKTSDTANEDPMWQRGYLKMQRELDLLGQRYKLSESDQAIKAKVFESKEFQNELQKIQLEWMKDGDITPQHIYQGIMMLLSKMM